MQDTSLSTPPRPFEWGFRTDATLGTTFTERGYTTTRPLSIANESVVIKAPPNHLSLGVVGSASGGTITVRVIGWSADSGADDGRTAQWRPKVLFVGTLTMHNVKSASANGSADMYPMISCTAVMGSANASIVDGTGYKCPGDILIDCRGSRLIEIGLTASSSPTANIGIDAL